MTLFEILGVLETGLAYGIVALGAFLTFKILDFPDLTVEGSFPLGAAVCATLISLAGFNPWVATICAAFVGFFAGFITALLNVRYQILHILAGILVAIALYSVNLRIMGRPNLPLLGDPSVFDIFTDFGIKSYWGNPILLGIVALLCKFGLDAFLATGHGLSMRASGANPEMAKANGVNVGAMKLYGVGLANFLTGLAGALFAQIFGAADAYMGIGVIIIGLASVIGGMSIMPSRKIAIITLSCLVGAVLYRLAIAAALNADFIGLQASDVNLVAAVLVAIALISTNKGFSIKKMFQKNKGKTA